MSTIAQNAKAIFLEAVEKHAPEDWPAFLDKACGEDRELRQRVEGLLQAHAEKDSLFDAADPTADYRPLEQTGEMIGPYKLRERLGAGGMGVVWAAERKKPIRQKVALKVIKPGMDSEQVIARFEAEREALALMDHPNIARVLDAGTTEQGRPYFAMELIHGVPITEYCDAHGLTVPERLRLFIQVCKAVQHAHQKGIIHRDIKPSNVLVTEHDGTPVPKVIDFGVAKALHQPLTDRSIYTGVFQAIGTLAYMSPEQATLSGKGVDTCADVYGLGVLLYELLTGTTPFDRHELEQAAFDEALRIIREEDAPAPSTRISTLGDKLPVTQGKRQDPTELGKIVSGDLDCIVMKALQKERSRRYGTADAFAADIERHLSNEPVEARPPSRRYRLSRFYRRNKAGVHAAAAMATLLLIGVIGTATGWMRANQQRQDAIAERTEAEKTRDEYFKLLQEHRGSLIEKALQYAILGDVDEVDKIAATAEELGVPSDWILTLKGAAHLHRGENDAARNLLERAIKENDANVSAHAMLLIACYHSGDTEAWREHASKIETWHPRKDFMEFDELFLGYAQFYVDFRKSADDLESVLKNRPTWIVPRAILAAAQAETANSTGDVEYIEKAVREIKGPRAIARDNPFVLAITLFVYNNALRLGKQIDTKDAEDVAQRLAEHQTYPLANIMRAEYYQLTSPPDSDREREAWNQVFKQGSFFASVATAELYRRGYDPMVVKAKVSDPESEIAQAMVLATMSDGDSQARALGVYERLSRTETSWNMRYKLLQLILLSRDPKRAQDDCRDWLQEEQPIIRKPQDALMKSAMEFILGDDVHPGLQSKSPDERFVAHYITALRAYSLKNPEATKFLETCTTIPINFTPESYWAKAFLARWSSPHRQQNNTNRQSR